MTTPVAFRALPCPKCKAGSGEPCTNMNDGTPLRRSHVLRTPQLPCGSYAAYQRHTKAGEEPCEACREANRRYMRAHRSTNPDRRQRDIDALAIRREATRLLIERHRAEFDALVHELREAAA